jgi:hypothetical protein
MMKKSTRRMEGRRMRNPLAIPCWITGLILAASASSAQGQVVRLGTEYTFARMAGDQIKPSITFSQDGGIIVWQDNATDGDGTGIAARRIGVDGTSRGERFRVNVEGTGQQENASVVTLTNGSRLFVWQGGLLGAQRIHARIMDESGVFTSGDVLVSPAGASNNLNPSVAVLEDGSAVVAWTGFGVDGSGSAVLVQRISSTGELLGAAVRANEFTVGNQHHPAIAPVSGGFAVAWVSDEQTGANRTDVFLRRFTAAGQALGSEVRVNTTSDTVAGPTLLNVDSHLWVGWSRLVVPSPNLVVQTRTAQSAWSVQMRQFNPELQPLGSERAVSNQPKGNQVGLRLTAAAGQVLAVWSSDQMDGSGLGVVGRFFSASGAAQGDAFVVNTITRDDQLNPTVGSHASGRFMVAWSDWRGINDGLELAMQRFVVDGQPLAAPSTPILSAVSSWQVKASWAPVEGLSVRHYEVLFNGTGTHITTDPFWSSPDVLPGTSHSVQVAYVLADGRKSPFSAAGVGRAWGKDQNGDGLPDDWQSQYFGSVPANWPLPHIDSDADGVSNRDEFLAGTSPISASDVLTVSIQGTSQGNQVQWKTKAGGIYVLQSSSNLDTWQDVGGFRFAASDTESLIVPSVPEHAYFRVKRIH